MSSGRLFHSSLKLTSSHLCARRTSSRCLSALTRISSSSSPLYVTSPTPSCNIQHQSYLHTTNSVWNEHVFNVQDEEDYTKRVTKNVTPVVVQFHASWCGPCKLLGPRLESLVAGKNGKVVLAKIDIDKMTELAVTHGVEAVPTVLTMKDGKVIDKFVGLKDDADLETFVQKVIN